jgi:hypothetical protein
MTQEDAEEVFELAENANRPLSLKEAADKLGYASPRAAARRISCAWNFFNNIGDNRTAAIIARSFVNQQGVFPW